jgi:hypothetical protein
MVVLLGWLRGILWPKRLQMPGSRRDLVESEKSEKTRSAIVESVEKLSTTIVDK